MVSERSLDGARGTLLLAGFYGRGNAGDEAMLQCACEAFEDVFDIAIAVDEHGPHPGFRDWYPYKGREIVHQQDLGFVHRTAALAGVLVAGGGLALAFGADILIEAAACGVPVAVAGVDIPHRTVRLAQHHPGFLPAYRALLAALTVRTGASAALAERLGLRATYAADFALRLPTDAAVEVQPDPRRALVVVREWPRDDSTAAYVGEVLSVIAALIDAGYAPAFLPFAPEDTRFLHEAGIAPAAPVIETWWNPRRMKQLIASSAVVITIGRLHPLIFAAPTGTPVAALGALRPGGARAPFKLRDMAAEFGVAWFEAPDALNAAIRAGRIRPADGARVAAATERLDASIAALRRAFGVRPA